MKLFKLTIILFLLFPLSILRMNGQCMPPNPMTVYIGCDSVAFVWPPVTGATQYIYMVSTSPTPSGTPTPTPTNSGSKGGLTPGTVYYIFTQTFCSSGPSPMSSISFTTAATCPCTAPTGITSTPAATSASFSWTAVSGATGYEYIVDQSSANPTGSGTSTITASGSKTGLTASTNYYIHVRAKCSATNFSSWTTASFTTQGGSSCAVPAGITITHTANSANISWQAVTGAVNYEYWVDQSSADPAGSGTSVTTTSATKNSLAPSTQYYAHVRTICGSGNSSWSAAQAFTTSATGVLQVQNDAFSMSAYPNPASTSITVDINGPHSDHGQLRVSALDGKIIKTIINPSAKSTIDIHALSSGLYFIEYSNATHHQIVKLNKE